MQILVDLGVTILRTLLSHIPYLNLMISNVMLVYLSIRKLDGFTKEERTDFTHFTNYVVRHFNQLTYLLNKDYMYSPFGYLGHHKLTANICHDASFVVIDVDHTSTDIYERLNQLVDEGLQCILGTTSSKQNLTKYRVLLPLSNSVTADEYRRLVKGIQANGLIADMDMASAKPAQAFYSYADSLVLSDLTGDPLIVEDYILPPPKPGEMIVDKHIDLSELLQIIKFYPYATKGGRTRALLAAGFQLLELGASDKQLEQALIHFNRTLLTPKDTNSLYRRVINFIKSRR